MPTTEAPPVVIDPTQGQIRLVLLISDDLLDKLTAAGERVNLTPAIAARRLLGRQLGLFGS